ncbi:hypothetical protein ACTXLT_09135 [Brachybacterium alimentarium]|uniref:hypothetical protein n=1 Tax=Brachybacterium alimentarium TaxID=47845 RepID=UPI00403D7A17
MITTDVFELEAAMHAEDGPEQLWNERDHLWTIHQFARARLASPWAVLGTVILRALATVPPNVTLPPLVGGTASLNLFVALVGKSGSGKGAAMRAAGDAVTIVQPIPVMPLGSGEGLVRAYAVRETEEVNGERVPVTRILNTSIVFEVSEIDQLGAQGRRTGSTLMPQLRSAYSGEQLGSTYATTEKSVILDPNTYRLGLIAGVQPARSGTLLDDADGGTPQRFVWLPTTDPGVTLGTDEPSPYRLPVVSWPTSPWSIPVPAEAARAIREKRVATLRGEADPLDGHAMQTRLKVAAALAVLDGRQSVNREDWRLAGLVMFKSNESRAVCVSALEDLDRKRAQHQGQADAERTAARETALMVKGMDRIAGLITKHVTNSPEGITEGELNRRLPGRDRPHLAEAIGRAMDAGQIERSGTQLFPSS